MALHPEKYLLVLTSLGGSVNPIAMVRQERFGKLKKVTSSGLEPATF
jgi:hypothetical protein